MTRYVELRLGGSPVLLGLRSAFPREIRSVDPFKRDILLRRMRAAPGAMLAIRQGIDALALPVTARLLADAELARQIEEAVRRDGLVFVSLGTSANQLRPQPYHPAAERSAKVSEWSTGEKIEEALRRAIRLVPGEIGKSIAAMLSPEAIATTIGMMVALAVANAMGVGVVLDGALAAYAFYAAGMAGMRALAEFVGATGGLLDARDEKDIDRAAQVYAQALVVLGTAFLQRFLKAARRKADAGVSSKKSGGSGTGLTGGGERPQPAARLRQAPLKTPILPGSPENLAAYDRYMQRAKTVDVSTPRNSAVFYSGPGNRLRAESFAAANGKTTLEMTKGGEWLDKEKLFGPESPLTPGQAHDVWAELSKRYARGASGNAVGFVEGSRPGSIFNSIEFPALRDNPDVTNVITGGH